MSILNYTTKIDAWKTVGEIQQILGKHGVTHVSVRNENNLPVALTFTIDYKGEPLNFLLPCNHEGVLRCLNNDKKVPNGSKNKDQALRTSWRTVKNWIEAQLAIVEADLAPIQQVFISYLVLNSTGETLGQRMLDGNGIKLLNNE